MIARRPPPPAVACSSEAATARLVPSTMIAAPQHFAVMRTLRPRISSGTAYSNRATSASDVRGGGPTNPNFTFRRLTLSREATTGRAVPWRPLAATPRLARDPAPAAFRGKEGLWRRVDGAARFGTGVGAWWTSGPGEMERPVARRVYSAGRGPGGRLTQNAWWSPHSTCSRGRRWKRCASACPPCSRRRRARSPVRSVTSGSTRGPCSSSAKPASASK